MNDWQQIAECHNDHIVSTHKVHRIRQKQIYHHLQPEKRKGRTKISSKCSKSTLRTKNLVQYVTYVYISQKHVPNYLAKFFWAAEFEKPQQYLQLKEKKAK